MASQQLQINRLNDIVELLVKDKGKVLYRHQVYYKANVNQAAAMAAYGRALQATVYNDISND